MKIQKGISALIFDLDGTLLHTLPDLAASVNFCRAHFGLPTLAENEIRAFIGDGVKKLLERAFAATDVEVEAAYQVMKPYYRDHLFDKTWPYDKVVETLREIPLPMVVVTNKPSEYVKPLLDHFGLSKFFKMTIGGDTLPKKKPDPLALGVVADKLKVKREEIVMVGDGNADLEFAKNGGIRSVYCAFGYGDPQNCIPTWKISQFTGLLEVLAYDQAEKPLK